ncbi:hypothetical protein CVS40_6747 [Lucilia cuprina]|nr:hypothetical protein CVS40_6747 [Lucilia cuprina]
MVVKVSAPMGNVRKATVVLNKETLVPMRECGGKVYYGFDSISLRICRSDAKRSATASGSKLEAPPSLVLRTKKTPSLPQV